MKNILRKFRWKLVIELLYILRVFMKILHYSRFCNICSSYLTTLWSIFIDPCWKHCAFIYYISLWIVSKQNQWQRKFILRETQTFFSNLFQMFKIRWGRLFQTEMLTRLKILIQQLKNVNLEFEMMTHCFTLPFSCLFWLVDILLYIWNSSYFLNLPF